MHFIFFFFSIVLPGIVLTLEKLLLFLHYYFFFSMQSGDECIISCFICQPSPPLVRQLNTIFRFLLHDVFQCYIYMPVPLDNDMFFRVSISKTVCSTWVFRGFGTIPLKFFKQLKPPSHYITYLLRCTSLDSHRYHTVSYFFFFFRRRTYTIGNNWFKD